MHLLDVLRRRAPVHPSLVAITVDSGYAVYQRRIGCCCPVCGDLRPKRQRVKRWFPDLEREHRAAITQGVNCDFSKSRPWAVGHAPAQAAVLLESS